jgi:hypothetical protein
LAKTREAESDLGNAESYKDDFIDVVLQRKVNFKKNPITAAVFRGKEPETKPCLNIRYLDSPNSCPAGDRLDKDAFAVRYFGSSSEEYSVCGHGNLAIGLSAKIDDALDNEDGIVFFNAQALKPFELKMVEYKETDPGHPEAKFEMNMGEEKMFRSFECCNPNDLKDDQTAEGCSACPMLSHEFAQAKQILARRFGMKAADADQITRIFLAPGGQGYDSGWCPESAVTVELASEEALKNIDKRPSDKAWKADLASTSEKVAKSLPPPFPQQVKIIGERVVPANTPDPKGEKDIWKVYGTEDEPLQYRGYLAYHLEEKTAGKQKFKCRCMYPQLGVPEDVATGSANALMTHPLTTYYSGIQKTASKQMAGEDKDENPTFEATGQMKSRKANGYMYVTGQVQKCYDQKVQYDEDFEATTQDIAKANPEIEYDEEFKIVAEPVILTPEEEGAARLQALMDSDFVKDVGQSAGDPKFATIDDMIAHVESTQRKNDEYLRGSG